MCWQRLLVRSARQGGLVRRSALAFCDEGGCSWCLVFAGAAMNITLWSLRCWRDEVALGSVRPEGQEVISLGILCMW